MPRGRGDRDTGWLPGFRSSKNTYDENGSHTKTSVSVYISNRPRTGIFQKDVMERYVPELRYPVAAGTKPLPGVEFIDECVGEVGLGYFNLVEPVQLAKVVGPRS